MNSNRFNNKFEKSLVILALVLTGMTATYISALHLRWMSRRSAQPTPNIHKITTQSTLNNLKQAPISLTRDDI